MRGALLIDLPGLTPYGEAFALQRALAEEVKAGTRRDTVILLEHEPVVTLGRRTDEATELHSRNMINGVSASWPHAVQHARSPTSPSAQYAWKGSIRRDVWRRVIPLA